LFFIQTLGNCYFDFGQQFIYFATKQPGPRLDLPLSKANYFVFLSWFRGHNHNRRESRIEWERVLSASLCNNT